MIICEQFLMKQIKNSINFVFLMAAKENETSQMDCRRNTQHCKK